MPAPVFTPLVENLGGAICSELLACSDTLVTASDWQILNQLLEEVGPAVACSELLPVDEIDPSLLCSDRGVGITPLLEQV